MTVGGNEDIDVELSPPAQQPRTGVIRLSVSRNEAMSEELIDRVNAACDASEDARGDSVIVVHLLGAGRDRESWPGPVSVHLVSRWERALRRLERTPSATIAYADRLCSGPCAEIVLATDYRIVTASFVFRLPADRWRPWPGTALYRLVTQLGLARARRLALFGESLSAATAARWHVVDEVHPRGTDIEPIVDAAAERYRGLSGTELAVRRRLLFDALGASFEDALGAHLAACDRTLRRGTAEDRPAPPDPPAAGATDGQVPATTGRVTR